MRPMLSNKYFYNLTEVELLRQIVIITCDCFTMMKLNSNDINRLIRACEMYKDQTGSEYMWGEYEHLVKKLRYYQEENCDKE